MTKEMMLLVVFMVASLLIPLVISRLSRSLEQSGSSNDLSGQVIDEVELKFGQNVSAEDRNIVLNGVYIRHGAVVDARTGKISAQQRKL